MPRRLLLLTLLWLPHLACAAAPAATTRPSPITYAEDVRKDPPLHLHVLTIDLTDPAVSIVVRPAGKRPDNPAVPDGRGPWATTLLPVRTIAARDDLAAAVNGDFFSPKDTRDILGRKVPYFIGNPARPIGHARSDGQPWADPVNANWPLLTVSPNNQISIVRRPQDVPKGAREVVGGSLILIQDGKVVPNNAEPRAPRTAAGVDKDNKRLVLLVVDGRRPEYSAGLTIAQLADEMQKLGCHQAINLDGGGSSTMILRHPDTDIQELKNRPSDGHDFLLPLSVERPVANVLGVRLAKPAQPK